MGPIFYRVTAAGAGAKHLYRRAARTAPRGPLGGPSRGLSSDSASVQPTGSAISAGRRSRRPTTGPAPPPAPSAADPPTGPAAVPVPAPAAAPVRARWRGRTRRQRPPAPRRPPRSANRRPSRAYSRSVAVVMPVSVRPAAARRPPPSPSHGASRQRPAPPASRGGSPATPGGSASPSRQRPRRAGGSRHGWLPTTRRPSQPSRAPGRRRYLPVGAPSAARRRAGWCPNRQGATPPPPKHI